MSNIYLNPSHEDDSVEIGTGKSAIGNSLPRPKNGGAHDEKIIKRPTKWNGHKLRSYLSHNKII